MPHFCWSVLLALCLAFPAGATESAWVIHRGTTYLEMEPSFARYSNEQDSPVSELTLNDRLEIGFLDYASFFLQMPFVTRTRQLDSTTWLTNNGLTDLHLGAYFQLLTYPAALALKTALKVPTGYDPTALPTIGDRQLDLELELLGGYQFPQWPLYVQGGLGYRLRTPYDLTSPVVVAAQARGEKIVRPSDQILWMAEAGIWLTPQWFAALNLQGDVGLFQNEAFPQSVVLIRPLIAWRAVPAMDLSLQFEQALWSLNSPYITGFRLGAHYRFGTPQERGTGLRGTDPPAPLE